MTEGRPAPGGEEVVRLFPGSPTRLAAEDVYGDVSFPGGVPLSSASREARPYVAINMVASVDGRATAAGGKAGPIGGAVDRVLMRTLRARADAVMVGAGTVRAERLSLAVPENLARQRASRGLPPQPLAVVATRSGDVPLEKNLIGPTPENLIVLASPKTPDERLAELSSRARAVEVVPSEANAEAPDLRALLTLLGERYGVRALLVEGGPSLNHALARAGLADELFLTLAPKLLGGAGPGSPAVLEGPTLPPARTRPSLVTVHLHADELYLRYRLRLQ